MLKGNNIILRPLKITDLDFLYHIENNSDNWQFGGDKRIFSKSELIDYISNSNTDIELSKQFRFVIVLDNLPVGFIDLFNYKKTSVGLGIIITDNQRRKGYASEAINIISNYIFNTLKVAKIYANVLKDNSASIKLFKSCNFQIKNKSKEIIYLVKLPNI